MTWWVIFNNFYWTAFRACWFIGLHFIDNGHNERLENGVYKIVFAEVVARRCSVRKVFLEISQNSQENTCARDSFLIKLQANTFFTEHLRWLLLSLQLTFVWRVLIIYIFSNCFNINFSITSSFVMSV